MRSARKLSAASSIDGPDRLIAGPSDSLQAWWQEESHRGDEPRTEYVVKTHSHAAVGECSRTAVSRQRCELGNVIMGSWARRSRDSSMRSAPVVTVIRNPAAVG
jgi:hypothetical protein